MSLAFLFLAAIWLMALNISESIAKSFQVIYFEIKNIFALLYFTQNKILSWSQKIVRNRNFEEH
jgi:hypothetical protein